MKLKKLMGKFEVLLNTDKGKRKKRIRNLKKVLKKLSKHAKSLEKEKRKESNAEKKAKLDDKIALTQAQRIKGLELLKTLQADNQEKK